MTRRSYRHTAPLAGPVTARRVIPTRPPSVGSDFATPALVGALIGLWSGVLAGLLFWLVFHAFWIPCAIFALIFSLLGFIWRLSATDAAMLAIEEISRVGDAPEPAMLPMPREPILLNPYSGQQERESIRREQGRELAANFIRGCQYDTSARRWSGEPNYTRWREALIASGWAHWRKEGEPRAGWKLSADPEQVIAAMEEKL